MQLNLPTTSQAIPPQSAPSRAAARQLTAASFIGRIAVDSRSARVPGCRSEALSWSVLAAILLSTAGCASTFTAPTVDPKTPPQVVLDVQFPQGKLFTITPAGQPAGMPIQLNGNDELSLVASGTDNDGGIRNIQIFADATTINADGSPGTATTGSPVAESLDTGAVPGSTASQQRLASVTLKVPQLRGNFAGLKLDVSARATNVQLEKTDTKKVSLFWSRQSPLTLPPCARFSPIGFAPPLVLDSRAVTVDFQNAKAASPNRTMFVIGVKEPPFPNTLIFCRLTIEETGLPSTTAIVQLENLTKFGKQLLTVDGRNCAAAGKLLNVFPNTISLELVITNADTTTVLLSDQNVDVALWNEATFWRAFGGKRTKITWL